MQTLKFKTNLKCNGCVAAIKPGIEAISGVKNWEVNLESTDKELLIEGDDNLGNEVMDAVKSAGYTIEKM